MKLELPKQTMKPWMLLYTSVYGLLSVADVFDGAMRDHSWWLIGSIACFNAVVFIGNALYSFAWVPEKTRQTWRLVFPLVVTGFLATQVIETIYVYPKMGIGSATEKATLWVLGVILFMPALRAHYLLGYGKSVPVTVPSGDGAPNEETGPTRKPDRNGRIEWWHYILVFWVLVQCTLFLAPHVFGGKLSTLGWLLGIDYMLWSGVAVLGLISGLIWAAWKRPFWTHWRGVGYVGLICLAASPSLFQIYPSPHDSSPSTIHFRLPLDEPLKVAWGGATPEVNYHVNVPDQRWAYDLCISKDGRTFLGEGKRCEDYYIYNQPLLAPADGEVVSLADGDPDMPPGVLGGGKNPGGNHLVLRVATNEFLYLCHMKHGSICVKKGDHVKKGQIVGRVGNSGNTSEPHVHMHLQDSPDSVLAQGIPMHFQNYRVDGKLVLSGIPTGGITDGKFIGQIVQHVQNSN